MYSIHIDVASRHILCRYISVTLLVVSNVLIGPDIRRMNSSRHCFFFYSNWQSSVVYYFIKLVYIKYEINGEKPTVKDVI